MRQDQSFPAHLKSKKCDTFESLWGDFSENWSKISPQTSKVRIVPKNTPSAHLVQQSKINLKTKLKRVHLIPTSTESLPTESFFLCEVENLVEKNLILEQSKEEMQDELVLLQESLDVQESLGLENEEYQEELMLQVEEREQQLFETQEELEGNVFFSFG